RRLSALERHQDVLGGDAGCTAHLRRRPEQRLAPQPWLCRRLDALRPQDRQAHRNGRRLRPNVGTPLTRIPGPRLRAAPAPRSLTLGDGSRGLHRLRSRVVALRLQGLEAISDPQSDVRTDWPFTRSEIKIVRETERVE